MGIKNGQDLETQHAFLVAWGYFAQQMGLIEALQAVSLKQKTYRHRPQTKVLEFLVALMSVDCVSCKRSVWQRIRWTRTRPWRRPGDSRVGRTTRASAAR